MRKVPARCASLVYSGGMNQEAEARELVAELRARWSRAVPTGQELHLDLGELDLLLTLAEVALT